MSSKFAISVRGVSKCYQIYDQPIDRLKQGIIAFAARVCPSRKIRDRLSVWAQRCARQYWALEDISFNLKKAKLSALSVATDQVKVPCSRFCAEH
jgi:lipopolysaccharide transport system ATP-binding protein